MWIQIKLASYISTSNSIDFPFHLAYFHLGSVILSARASFPWSREITQSISRKVYSKKKPRQTEVRKNGQTKCNCSRLAFKSQRYRIGYRSNQKLLHHSLHAKNQLNSKTHSENTADFSVAWTKWLRLTMTTPTQKSLKLLLAFLNLHQHAKKSVHSICSFLKYSQF